MCIKIVWLLLQAAVAAIAMTGVTATALASASSSMTAMRAVVVVNGLWDLRAIYWQLSLLCTGQEILVFILGFKRPVWFQIILSLR